MSTKTTKTKAQPAEPTHSFKPYPACTVKIRHGKACINVPRAYTGMKTLFRITTADGVIRITPTRGKGSVKVTAKQDGKWSYVPMPAETAGIRYRRIQDETTGEMTMTPIPSTVKNGGT